MHGQQNIGKKNPNRIRAAFRSTVYFKKALSTAEHWLDDASSGRNESEQEQQFRVSIDSSMEQ
jgi:hypothetical protein